MKKHTKKVVAFGLTAVLAAGVLSQTNTVQANQLTASAKQAAFVMKNVPLTYRSIQERAELHKEAEALPDRFDLRDVDGKNYVTLVKSQSPWSSCWSFGVIAASETSLLYENGMTNEEYMEQNGGRELDLSEKALAWFATHKITDADVCDEAVSASQVGEGVDLDEQEKANSNAAYNLGGFPLFGSSLFSSGIGPKSEETRFEGEEDEYPYEYRGKNGLKTYDYFVSEDPAMRQTIHDYYLSLYYPKYFETEADFEVWYERYKQMMIDAGPVGAYSEFDDWSIPVDYKHRIENNYAVLQESAMLPSPAMKNLYGEYEGFDQAGLDAIKMELNAGRPVAIAFHADQAAPGDTLEGDVYINVEGDQPTWAQYTYRDTESANHVVTIVGYDDHYSKDNFLQGKTEDGIDRTPQGDGAFIVKNSWGSLNDSSERKPNYYEWGIDGSGYFYLSYYDKTLSCAESFNYFTKKDGEIPDESIINQYDFMPANWIAPYYQADETSMSNVFPAALDQKLTHISVLTGTPESTVNYEVYKLKDGFSDPKDGELLTQGSETFKYAGYHRIALNGSYLISKGDHFSVVVTQVVADDSQPSGVSYEWVAYANNRSNYGFDGSIYDCNGVINKGESWLFNDGKWLDWKAQANLLISQFRTLYGDDITVDNFSIKAYSIPVHFNTIKLNGEEITEAETLKVKSSKVQKKAVSFVVEKEGDGKVTMANKSPAALKKYLKLKGDKVVLKKGAPKGNYKCTLTVAESEAFEKTTTPLITIKVQ